MEEVGRGGERKEGEGEREEGEKGRRKNKRVKGTLIY